TRLSWIRLPSWVKLPPPSPSPLTRSDRTIPVLPWMMLPLMWTLPTLASAAVAFFSHASVGVPGATTVTGVVAVVGAAAGGLGAVVVLVAATMLAPAPAPAPAPGEAP